VTIKEIVTEYLKANGFDGLCNIEVECGCLLKEDGGLMLCDDPSAEHCEPGYKCHHPDHPAEWAICTEKPTDR
jgi:hypothetical protein